MWGIIAKAAGAITKINPADIGTQINLQDVIDFAISMIGGH